MIVDAPLWWEDGALGLLDQTGLPHEVRTLRCGSWEEVADAIRALRVRGAPAIGLAAAYGLVLAASACGARPLAECLEAVRRAAAVLRTTRPTAVNLGWAIDRMLEVAGACDDAPSLPQGLLDAANALARADLETNRRIGEHGAALLRAGARVLTYCNTGMLATAGYGTAFGVLRRAHEQGRGIHVIACETRPVLQGARLTAWELLRAGIPATLITDNAGSLPSTVTATLTWSGTAQTPVSFSTTGFHAGDLLTFAVQSTSTVSSFTSSQLRMSATRSLTNGARSATPSRKAGSPSRRISSRVPLGMT